MTFEERFDEDSKYEYRSVAVHPTMPVALELERLGYRVRWHAAVGVDIPRKPYIIVSVMVRKEIPLSEIPEANAFMAVFGKTAKADIPERM